MQDFTLVIPTYNRPNQLRALLTYLSANGVQSPVLILDSSEPKPRAANRRIIAQAKINLDYVEFPTDTHPFDKFREGVYQVTTPFCALCADDDLIVPDGVERCLAALVSNPQASAAQGYSFSFLCRMDGNMEIGNILYFSSTIADATPLARLAKLFARYQAATYANYRTPVLQRILDATTSINSILARELLGSALAAVEGQIIRVPCFSHGRSMDASESYDRWHPLEWFAKDADGLFSEYRRYREVLAKAVLTRTESKLDAASVCRVIDLIHSRYLIKHVPDSALGFITEQKLARVPFDRYWPSETIHRPLYEAAGIGTVPATTQVSSEKRGSPGSTRVYKLHPNFFAPLGVDAPDNELITHLLKSLNYYHFKPASRAPVRRPPSRALVRRPQPLDKGRPVTVSVLLCNYNDGRYLPDSLSAICTQTRRPDEVIVLDDGSTDNSLEIIEDFARRHPFIRVLKNDTNRGLLYSINRALNEARSNFVVWAAADDRLLPNFLERNAQYLRDYPAGMSFSRLALFRDGSDEISTFTEKTHGVAFDFGKTMQFLSPELLRQRLERSFLWMSANTVMASRSALIEAGGFDKDLRWHADYFGFLVVALRHGVCCIPETLALMRQRPQTYSSEGIAKRDEQRATLGHLADKLTTKDWWDIGIAVLRCPSVLSPFGSLMLQALVLKPRRWPFAVTYGLWWANHQWSQRPNVTARAASHAARASLQATQMMLKGARRFIHWASRR
jgi:glycosyltransferase domain-containing protein